MNLFPIVKSNKLVMCTSEDHYTSFDYDLINYAISTIPRKVEELKPVTVNLSTLYEKMLSKPLTGKKRMEVIKDAKSLMKKTIVLEDGDQKIVLNWISEIVYHKNYGDIEVIFNDRMIKHLTGLGKNTEKGYTSFNNRVYVLEKIYTKRLYEMMESLYAAAKSRVFTIEELREHLMVSGKYSRVTHLRSRVIEPAIKEINYHADFTLEYEVVKDGRRVVGFKFTKTKKSKEEIERLEQLSLF